MSVQAWLVWQRCASTVVRPPSSSSSSNFSVLLIGQHSPWGLYFAVLLFAFRSVHSALLCIPLCCAHSARCIYSARCIHSARCIPLGAFRSGTVPLKSRSMQSRRSLQSHWLQSRRSLQHCSTHSILCRKCSRSWQIGSLAACSPALCSTTISVQNCSRVPLFAAPLVAVCRALTLPSRCSSDSLN